MVMAVKDKGAAARKAWATRRANGYTPKQRTATTSDRSEAALKAWATRRRQSKLQVSADLPITAYGDPDTVLCISAEVNDEGDIKLRWKSTKRAWGVTMQSLIAHEISGRTITSGGRYSTTGGTSDMNLASVGQLAPKDFLGWYRKADGNRAIFTGKTAMAVKTQIQDAMESDGLRMLNTRLAILEA